MRYILLFMFVFLFNSYATCPLRKVLRVDYYPPVSNFTCFNDNIQCSYEQDFTCTTDENGGILISEYRTLYEEVYVCPEGTSPDSNNVCKAPPPPPPPAAKCEWAVQPPWVGTMNTQLQCHNGNIQSGPNSEFSYLWNYRWCDVNQKCYALEYYCPKGQIWSSLNNRCQSPNPYLPDCGSCGTYKIPGSIEGPSGKQCFIDYVCKCDSKVRTRVDVSCAFDPLHPDPEDPNHPTEDPTPAKSPTNTDHSAKCGTEKMMAQASCTLQPRHYLVFECDPLTGMVKKSQCLPTEQTPKKEINPGDDTKGSTTQDIKELGNMLPDSIRSALKDFFTDGSMPHLESIRGSMESSLILDSDRNDKLDSISASAEASLVLHTETNEKLDGVKSSMDGVKSSVDSQKSALDQIVEFFTDDTEFEGEDVTQTNLEPDSNTTDGYETFTNSITQIQNQFQQATNIMSGGVPNIQFNNGSCPSYSFMGHTVSLSSIGQSIAPYSSIFSILIYISLMITAFRLVFGFFSKGV